MKKNRQKRILQLITEYNISTQEELLLRLRESGLDVTQATISRDIKELRIVKLMGENGQYRYAVSDKPHEEHMENKFRSIFVHSVRSVDCAGYTLVLRCYNGTAQAACAAFDSMRWDSLVGSLAGDDTIFALFRTPQHASHACQMIQSFLQDVNVSKGD